MTNFTLDKDKYKAALLYIANELGSIDGMKKAYKLFYYLDFDFYEAFEKPFTGDTYKALEMGPVPVYFTGIANELVDEGKLKIDKKRLSPNHGNDTCIYTPLMKSDYKFSLDEKKMLDRIVKLYGSMTGGELEKLTHSEAPYNAVDTYQVIPYEYSLYRDTADLV
jgi:uncharacterized phage-associated protein